MTFGQAIKSAVAYFPSISCATSWRRSSTIVRPLVSLSLKISRFVDIHHDDGHNLDVSKVDHSFVRGLPYMTSAKFSDFLPPLVTVTNQLILFL